MTMENDFKATVAASAAAVQKIMDTASAKPEFQAFRRVLTSIGTRRAGLLLDCSRDGEKADMTNEFENVEIARKELPDVRFRGRLIAEADSKEETRQAGRQKDRWTRLEVWELESGAWVAASIGCSDKPGEIDVGDIEIIRATGNGHIADLDEKNGLSNVRAAPMAPQEMQRRAMEFFRWTWLAKALARDAGWDVVDQIE